MTAYYIDPVNGSDAFNGLGPDASHATNKPWASLNVALNTGSVISNAVDNTVWLAPGTCYSTVGIPITTIASTAHPLQIRGDPWNSQGFKTSGGVRVTPGIVLLTARTSGEGINGSSAAATNVIDGTINGTDGLQWYDLIVEAPNGQVFAKLSNGANADWLFDRVRSIGGALMQTSAGVPTANRNWIFRRCIFMGQFGLLTGGTTAAATADADMNVLVEGCLTLTKHQIGTNTGAGNKAGGFRFKGCTFIGSSTGASSSLVFPATSCSTVTPCRVEGCSFTSGQGVNNSTAGQVVDDGNNLFCCGTNNVNFTLGGTSKEDVVILHVMPDLLYWGLALNINDFGGWGPGSVAAQYASGWSAAAIADYHGRTPRPWGAGAAIGYIERGDISQDTASALSGVNSLKIIGAGEVSIPIPVAAVPTNITIRTKSTTYGGTNYPQMVITTNPSVGVSQIAVVATSATDQVLSTGLFTPTAAGVVEVRLKSDSSSTSSTTYFDVLTY